MEKIVKCDVKTYQSNLKWFINGSITIYNVAQNYYVKLNSTIYKWSYLIIIL